MVESSGPAAETCGTSVVASDHAGSPSVQA